MLAAHYQKLRLSHGANSTPSITITSPTAKWGLLHELGLNYLSESVAGVSDEGPCSSPLKLSLMEPSLGFGFRLLK